MKKQLHHTPTIIAHNNCKKHKSLKWANKAKTINHYAKKITTPYTTIIDADITIFNSTITAINREIKNKTRFGVANQIQTNQKNKATQQTPLLEFSGACWFIQTKILKKHPIPEDCVVEDTAYYRILKNKNIKAKPIYDAVILVKEMETNFPKKIRQSIRYYLGSLQLTKYKIYEYAITPILFAIIDLYLIVLMLQNVKGLLVLLLGVTLCVLFYRLLSIKKIDPTKGFAKGYLGLFNFFVAPLIAIYLFVRKKWVW